MRVSSNYRGGNSAPPGYYKYLRGDGAIAYGRGRMPDDLSRELNIAMLRMKHPGWTDEDMRRYLEWEGGNAPKLSDYVKRLWRILMKGKQK